MALVSRVEERDYPRRRYAEGESKLENKSINQNCRLGELLDIRDNYLGLEVWNAMKDLPIGIIAKLVDSSFVWSGKTVHYLLCRQLRVEKNEIWCLIGGQPIRFSLHEFGWITGLNTDPMPTGSCQPAEYEDFWKELNVPCGQGPKLRELRVALKVCRPWNFPKRKWLGLLLLQAIGIYGLHSNSRIPFESAIRVFDDEAVRSYPWGRTAFQFLVKSINVLKPEGNSYTVNGMVPTLQAWAYESITCFGERFGNVVNPSEVPLLRWAGKRTRSSLESVIAEEIKKCGEVRVVKMVTKEHEKELYPLWQDEEKDPKLNNLIVDIFRGTFVKGFWDVNYEQPIKKKKKKKKVMKDSGKKPVSLTEGEVDEESLKNNEVSNCEEPNLERNFSMESFLQRMDSRFDGLEGNFVKFEQFESRMIATVEQVVGDKVEAIVEKKYGARVDGVDDRVLVLEGQMRELLERFRARGEYGQDDNSLIVVPRGGDEIEVDSPAKKVPAVIDVDKSDAAWSLDIARKGMSRRGEEVDSPAKKVPAKIIDVDKSDATRSLDFVTVSPIKVNASSKANRKRKAMEQKNEKEEKEETGKKKKVKEQKDENKKEEETGKKKKEEKKRKEEEDKEKNGLKESIVPSRKRHIAKKKKDENEKEETGKKKKDEKERKEEEENSLKEKKEQEKKRTPYKIKSVYSTPPKKSEPKIVGPSFGLIDESLDDAEFDNVDVKELLNELRGKKKKQHISPPYTYIGDPILSRMMNKTIKPSKAIYDPMKKADVTKLEALTKHLEPYKGIALATELEINIEFYRRLVVADKARWPETDWGWLSDLHMTGFMTVLNKRNKKDPSPFYNTKIVFLDNFFVARWVLDFKDFEKDRVKYKFLQLYEEKVKDVDHIYFTFNTGGDHWVALHVDIVNGRIHCYDSIMSCSTAAAIKKQCMHFAIMLPYILNQFIPTRKKSCAKFTFTRMRDIPQNVRVGDCGVYACKFIECLALGVKLCGLDDRNIENLRISMAADILHEAPDLYACHKALNDAIDRCAS